MHGNTYLDPLARGNQALAVSAGKAYLSEESYGEIVQAMPITCTDVVFLVQSGESVDRALYLTKRSVFPQKDWWIVGGRVFFNDASLEDAISRNVKRETQVSIDPSRFEYLTTVYYQWVRTRQAEKPGRNVGITFTCVVSEAEMGVMSQFLSEAEYEPGVGMRRFTREEMVQEGVHPVLIDFYDEVFPSFGKRFTNAASALFGGR